MLEVKSIIPYMDFEKNYYFCSNHSLCSCQGQNLCLLIWLLLPMILNSCAPKGCTILCKSLCSRLQCGWWWRNWHHFFVLDNCALHQYSQWVSMCKTCQGVHLIKHNKRLWTQDCTGQLKGKGIYIQCIGNKVWKE